jgi:hypothetical protein
MNKLIVVFCFLVIHTTTFSKPSLIYNPSIHSNTSTLLKLNLKRDFNAIGNGINDDTEAFFRATEFLQKRKINCELFIPISTYRVGVQTIHPFNSSHIIYLKGCSRISIVGELKSKKKPIILYNNNLRFGAFDNVTNKAVPSQNNYYVYANRVDIGDCIFFDECRNMLINNLLLDGNFYEGKIIKGGTWGDMHWQAGHTGIKIHKSGNVIVKNTTVQRFGLDGLYINGDYTKEDQKNITVTNCIFDYNCRLGAGWCGGSDVKFNQCVFSNTGKGLFFSQPGSGLDIEPESIFTPTVSPFCKNGEINNCTFYNNMVVGLVGMNNLTSNIKINSCKFVSFQNPHENVGFGLNTSVHSPEFGFNNCKFYGSIKYFYNDANCTKEQGTQFKNCYFSDQLIENKIIKNATIYQNTLVSDINPKWLLFDGCTFETFKSNTILLSANTTQEVVLKNNKFTLHQNAKNSINLTNVTFDNNTIFQNSTKNSENNINLERGANLNNVFKNLIK